MTLATFLYLIVQFLCMNCLVRQLFEVVCVYSYLYLVW